MSDVHDDYDPFRRPTDTSERPAAGNRPGATEVDITDARMHASTSAGAAAPPADPDGSSVEAQRSDALAAWYTTATTPDGHLYGGDVEEGEMVDAEQPDGEVTPPDQAVPDTSAWYRTASAPPPEASLFERPPTPEQTAYQAPPYDPPQPTYGQSQPDAPRYDAPAYDSARYDAPDPYPPVTNTSDLYGSTSGNEPPRFERPPYEEAVPAGPVDDPFAPAAPAYDARMPGPTAVTAAAFEATVRPGAAPRRRPPSRRTRQRVTFGVIFGLVVLLGAAAAMAMNGRFDLPFGTGRRPPLPVCPSVAPTILPFGETSVHVLNASKINGLALKTTKDLQKLGFKVPTTPGNEPATTKVTGAALVRYGPSGLAAANSVKSAVNGPVQMLQDGRPGTDVDLVLGPTFKLKAGVKSPASPSAPAGKATCTPEPAAS